MCLGEYFDLIPSSRGGASNKYWCDSSTILNNEQAIIWGGNLYSDFSAGLANINSVNFTSSKDYYGARLAYYGPVTFVTPEYFKN